MTWKAAGQPTEAMTPAALMAARKGRRTGRVGPKRSEGDGEGVASRAQRWRGPPAAIGKDDEPDGDAMNQIGRR